MKENKIAGVYKITNNITGDFYIGSSKDIKLRWANHKSTSQWKWRPGMKLYQAFIKYGLNNFTFEVLEKTADIKEREQYWIEQLKPTYNDRHADGIDAERKKEWYEIHRDEMLAYGKDYSKAYKNRLCLYEGETLTLNALSARFTRQGIPHPTLNAKEYLL